MSLFTSFDAVVDAIDGAECCVCVFANWGVGNVMVLVTMGLSSLFLGIGLASSYSAWTLGQSSVDPPRLLASLVLTRCVACGSCAGDGGAVRVGHGVSSAVVSQNALARGLSRVDLLPMHWPVCCSAADLRSAVLYVCLPAVPRLVVRP
jgi:hypothetical protein